ncbi:MAG: urate hydroxylase PuuD [Solirubrobacteraceae bacterium]|nr:urate hydroxylase PuuD [Solirubrobacteraceae bacterium]
MTFAINWDYLRDVLGLLRWLHVFAAIIWIGLTAFFWFMESHLKTPIPGGPEPTDGVSGETYYLHGGIFYFRRYKGGPDHLPANVTWHPQWYAYGTWVTGFLLLCIVYFWKANTYLLDPSVADISPVLGVTICVALLAFSWLFYDRLSRWLIERERLLVSLLFIYIVAVSYGLSHLLSSRGVVIEVGAVIGTWMAGNVLFVWEPLHRMFFAAKSEHRIALDEGLMAISWQRAKHNAYLAPPVLFAMLGVHFSFVSGSRHAWLALIGFMIVGGLLRYFYIWRNRSRVIVAIPAVAGALLIALVIWLAPSTAPAPAPATALTAGDAGTTGGGDAAVTAGRAVFAKAGCGSCHTLTAAGAAGTAGPSLDQAKPSAALVSDRVTQGVGTMPSFSGKLSAAEIKEVATYVSTVAGK